MFHGQDINTDLGNVKIHRNVIASIAALAAAEIDGVVRTGMPGLHGSFLKITRQTSYGAIKVEFDKNEDVLIHIPLIVKFGFNIPDIAARIQENVRAQVEIMTNLSVKDITITVVAAERG